MESEAYRLSFARAAFLPRFLRFAFAVSIALYGVIVFTVVQSRENTPETLIVVGVLASVAALMALASIFVRRVAFSDSRLSQFMAQPVQHADAAGLSPLETRLLQLLVWALAPWLISLVLAESVAVFGLVLSFISGDRNAAVPFLLLALVLILLCTPPADSLLDRAKGLYRG
jgi:hypothetical protein